LFKAGVFLPALYMHNADIYPNQKLAKCKN